jgi:hypothetical protein
VTDFALAPQGQQLYLTASMGANGIAVYNRGVAPVCFPPAATTKFETAVSLKPACFDANGDTIRLSLLDKPAHGSMSSFAADGTVKYTPDFDFSGTDTFTLVASDGGGASGPVTATVTVDKRPADLAAIGGGTIKLKTGAVPLRMRCTSGSGKCAGTVKITARVRSKGKTKTITLGSKRYSLPAGRTSTFSVGLSKTNQKLVKSTGKKGLTASVAATQTGGGDKRTASLTLKA